MRRDPARSGTPCTYGHASQENREILCPPATDDAVGHIGKSRTYADDEWTGDVGQACSTREVPEQRRATGRGGAGGEGLVKGNRIQKHRPIGHSAGLAGLMRRAGTSRSRQGQDNVAHSA